ncbi:MAG: transglutaminase domain-containing protein [Eubacteriales bacterium]
MKKGFCVILLLFATLTCCLWVGFYEKSRPDLPEPSQTETDEPENAYLELEVPALSFGELPSPTLSEKKETFALLSSTDNSALDAYYDLYNAMIAMESECSLSQYQLTKDEVGELFADVINHSPELFYVFGRCGVSYNKTTLIVSKVSFSYTMGEAEAAEALAFYRQSIEAILEQIPEGMSDFDRVLWLHDYLCIRYRYDNEMTNFDAYTFLRDGKGVCQAYTLTYMALLQACGIQVDYATSDEMNHIWNLVELDGAWYHVDVTWDDPISRNQEDIPGRAGHDAFLCSDSAMVQNGHYNWIARTCDSELYDGAFLDTINTALAYIDGVWYTVDRQNGMVRSISFPDMTTVDLFPVDGIWYRWDESGYYVYRYSNLCTVDGILYFSTPTAIGSYDPESGEIEIVNSYIEGEGYLYALWADGTVLSYGIATAPDSSLLKVLTYDTAAVDPPETDELPIGMDFPDLNCGDGTASALVSVISGEDVLHMRYVMVANLENLSYYRSPSFCMTYYKDGEAVREYRMGKDDIEFCLSITDTKSGDRFTAADGYCLFGLSVEMIPVDAWSEVELEFLDEDTGEILFLRTITNEGIRNDDADQNADADFPPETDSENPISSDAVTDTILTQESTSDENENETGASDAAPVLIMVLPL